MVAKRTRAPIAKSENLNKAKNTLNSANTAIEAELDALDKSAPRTYKKINIGFNEFEYNLLALAAEKDSRGVTSFARKAIVDMARKALDK